MTTSPPGAESVQLEFSKLSLAEVPQPPFETAHVVKRTQPGNAECTPVSSHDQKSPEDKSKWQEAYSETLSSTTKPQVPQYVAEPVTYQFPPPPPPYSPNPQAGTAFQPLTTDNVTRQQSQPVYTQQHSQSVQQPLHGQHQLQQQAQIYVQQQTPYHSVAPQQQYTQVQVQNPVMGLQNPQYAQAQLQQIHPLQQGQSSYWQEAPPGILAHKPGKDDEKTGKVTRFLGDTLVGRFARSGVSTVTTTLKMPAILSPWGDNNPVTLPNVRYRDAILFGTFAVVGAPLVDGMSDAVTSSFGADHFISEVVSSGAGFITGNTIVKYGVFQIVEQAIDKGMLEHVLPEVEKTMRTTTAKTLQVCIKHKLMDVEADIRMHGPYPAPNSTACDKGWFAPYLFASSRTPVIRRAEDFAMAQFFKPYLIGKLPYLTPNHHVAIALLY